MTMPTKIQMRRGTAAQWTSANPVLLSGEQGFETDTKKTKIGDGVTPWNSLGYAFVSNDLVSGSKGALITSNGTSVTALTVGATNGHTLRVNSATATGLEWGAVESLPNQTGNNGSLLTTNGTSASWTGILSTLINLSPEERCNVVASAATGTINLNTATSSVWFYTSNASGNWTLNVRGDSTSTLNSLLATGDSITVAFLNTNGATAYYQTAFQIDGSGVTPRWLGGSAPAAGNASAIDVYTFTIIKTASTPTYTVLGSQNRYV
jgi:hypothetical protein